MEATVYLERNWMNSKWCWWSWVHISKDNWISVSVERLNGIDQISNDGMTDFETRKDCRKHAQRTLKRFGVTKIDFRMQGQNGYELLNYKPTWRKKQ